MRRLPPHLAPLGYSPRRYAPLSPAPVLGMGERMTDLLDIQAIFANGEQGGYWPADPAYAYEDSAGTIPASVNGVTGLRTNAVTGYPNAIQATTANKPYLRQTPVSGKYWYDSNTATGALNVTFASSLGSACTIATVTPEGVSILENQTVGATYNICPPCGYNSDVLIINRALTAAEKALVTRVMQRSVPTLGSEIVVNGGFDTDTVWSKGTGWTIGGGVASNDGYNNYLIQNFIPPSSYQPLNGIGITLSVLTKINISITSGTLYVGGGSINSFTTSISGNYNKVLTRSNESNGFLYIGGAGWFIGSIDNVSFRVLL